MKVYAGGTSVELDGVVTQGGGSGPVLVYTEGATVEVRDAAPASAVGVLHVEKLDRSKMVFFEGWHSTNSAYERSQSLKVIKPGIATFRVGRMSFASASPSYRPAKNYTLLIDGAPFGEFVFAEWQNFADLKVDVSGLPHGWRHLSVGGLSDGENCPTWFVCMLRDGLPPPDTMPVATGSYDFHWDSPRNEHAWTYAPAVYKPTPRPLKPGGPYLPFSDAAKAERVKIEMLIPGQGGNVFLPNADANGLVSSFNRQAYYWDADFTRKYPRVALLDGPRGVGALCFATHIDIGQARVSSDPASRPMYNIYVTDPWRLTRVSDTGTITTLAGYRHRGMASAWATPDVPGVTQELVGDWSAVPEARRGFHELWGMCWKKAGLEETAGAPIPAEDNRIPHVHNPVCFVTDSQNNRVCRIEFDGRSHATPAKVSEFIVGMQDPWDIVAWRDEYVISERAANRIVAYDLQGRFKRVIAQHDPSNVVESYLRNGVRTMGLRGGDAATRKETAKLHPCIGPEGLYVRGDWLYFGSHVLEEVRRVHLVTGVIEFVCAVEKPDKFVKIAVSDGTFGPVDTVFMQTWSIYSVHQWVFTPDGVQWKLQASSPWGGTGYGSAVAVGGGRLYTGTSNYGIRRYSLGTPYDRVKFERGEKQFEAMHGRILYGTQGFSHYGAELPWGRSADLDYFLETNGHQR